LAVAATTATLRADAAMYRKRSSSFFEDQSQGEAAPLPPYKRARLRGDDVGGGSPRPRGAVDPALAAVLRARFPSVRLEVMSWHPARARYQC
jgi:hypothetical protein